MEALGFGEFCEDESLGWILEVVSTPAAKNEHQEW